MNTEDIRAKGPRLESGTDSCSGELRPSRPVLPSASGRVDPGSSGLVPTRLRRSLENVQRGCLALLLCACMPPALAAAGARPQVYPGKTWAVAARPEGHGFSAARLALARQYADTIPTAAVVVVRDGVVVSQWGGVAEKYRSHSMRKSFLSALYGRYIVGGALDRQATLADLGIDEVRPPSSAPEGRGPGRWSLPEPEPSLSPVEKSATVLDLLKARSGVYHAAAAESDWMRTLRPPRFSQRPGTHWYYNNWDFNVLGAIYEKVAGRSIYDAIKEDIAGPIGMEDYVPSDGEYSYAPVSIHPAYPFRVTARDLARFGLLMLRGGQWEGRQVIDAGWVEESTRYHSDATLYHSDGYGYMWWVARRHNKFPHVPGADIPEGSFSARGSGGHEVLVMPAYDMVIVHRVNTDLAGHHVADFEFGRLVQLILDAMLPGEKERASAARGQAVR